MQGLFNIRISINLTYYFNCAEEKMNSSIDNQISIKN